MEMWLFRVNIHGRAVLKVGRMLYECISTNKSDLPINSFDSTIFTLWIQMGPYFLHVDSKAGLHTVHTWCTMWLVFLYVVQGVLDAEKEIMLLKYFMMNFDKKI